MPAAAVRRSHTRPELGNETETGFSNSTTPPPHHQQQQQLQAEQQQQQRERVVGATQVEVQRAEMTINSFIS